ncbi:hypothetical protein ACLB2K_020541 [Fragaria x ananassa]
MQGPVEEIVAGNTQKAFVLFAFEYGAFCLLAQVHQFDLIVKSICHTILKGVPILLKSAEFQKRWQSVVESVALIKTTLEVIECNFELEKVSEFEPKEFCKGCTTKVILVTSVE